MGDYSENSQLAVLGFFVYIKTHYSQPPRERVGLLSVDLNRKLKFKACFGLKDVTACWCGVSLSLQSSTFNKKTRHCALSPC